MDNARWCGLDPDLCAAKDPGPQQPQYKPILTLETLEEQETDVAEAKDPCGEGQVPCR